MSNKMKIFLFCLSLFTMISLIGCGSPPIIEVDADYVTVGFGDNKVKVLDKNADEFTEIANEAIRIYQYGGLATECYFGLSEIESIKLNERFVDVGFAQAIEVPTSQNINDLEAEARDKINVKTTEEGYIISELVSIVCFFSGEYDGYLLYRPDERYAVWYCFKSSRGFSRLERMADTVEE